MNFHSFGTTRVVNWHELVENKKTEKKTQGGLSFVTCLIAVTIVSPTVRFGISETRVVTL